jgi:hypothetical protein
MLRHAIAGDTAFETQDRLERPGRALLKLGVLLHEMLGYNAPGHGMHAHIGHLVQPLPRPRKKSSRM